MDCLPSYRGPALCLLILLSVLPLAAAPAVAQTQSHPLSQISPTDTNLDLNSRNITSLNYLLYTGGIFYSGSQGIPSADIATSAVTGAKIASGVITAGKMSNPLGGSINASAYYDSDTNSSYYLDPGSTGTSLNTAGTISTGSFFSANPTLGRVSVAGDVIGSRLLDYNDNSYLLDPANSGNILLVAGRVGIGTTSAAEKLDVSGNIMARRNSSGVGAIGDRLKWSTNGPYMASVQENADDDVQGLVFATHPSATFAEPAVEKFRINSAGLVGIGTASPESLLHVNGSNPDIRIHNSGNSWGESEWPMQATNAVGVGQLQFLGGADGGALAHVMSPGSNGRVDIGIGGGNTPQSTLNVIGLVNFTQSESNTFLATFNSTNTLGSAGGLKVQTTGGARALDVIAGYGPAAAFLNGNVGIGTASPSKQLAIAGGTGGSTHLTFDTSSSTSGYTGSFVINGTGLIIGHNSASRDFRLQTNSQDRLTITSGGDVGIGVSPSGAKLDVSGILKVTDDDTGAQIRLERTDVGQMWITRILAGGEFIIENRSSGSDVLTIEPESPDDLLTTDKDGLGINTTNAVMSLDVNGGIRMSTTQGRPTCTSTIRGTLWFSQASPHICGSDTRMER